MHPEFARRLMAQRQAELLRKAELARQRDLARQAQPVHRGRELPGAAGPPYSRRGWWLALWRGAPRPGSRAAAGSRGEVGLPGVFLEGREAFGFRTYLTAAEARQLAKDWSDLLRPFADRVDDPARRPAGAVPFEVVVLGRQVPDLAGAGRGLPGPGARD